MSRSNKPFVSFREFNSSFLSCEKDAETILKKLFVESQPHSDNLKRLLTIDAKDCLTNTTKQEYKDRVKQMSLSRLIHDGFIRLQPRILMKENESVKSYLLLSFDNFVTNKSNPYYRDCVIELDIISHISQWDIGNYSQRPIKITGYIDAILNNSRLSGIGNLTFLSCNEIVLSEEIAGYCLMYQAIHGDDDYDE